MNSPEKANSSMHPDEIRSWLQAFDTDPCLAFYMIPNDTYSELRRFGYVDVEHELTDKGRDWLQKYNSYQQMVVHCPALGLEGHA